MEKVSDDIRRNGDENTAVIIMEYKGSRGSLVRAAEKVVEVYLGSKVGGDFDAKGQME